MNYIKIKIIDSGYDRYRLECDTRYLGRMYDNNATKIIIECPEAELNNDLDIILSTPFKTIAKVRITDNFIISNFYTQYENMQIGFSFSSKDGYCKNTEFRTFEFLPAKKPEGIDPEAEVIRKVNKDLVDYFNVRNEYNQFNFDLEKIIGEYSVDDYITDIEEDMLEQLRQETGLLPELIIVADAQLKIIIEGVKI